jgi:hypothetical protein
MHGDFSAGGGNMSVDIPTLTVAGETNGRLSTLPLKSMPVTVISDQPGSVPLQVLLKLKPLPEGPIETAADFIVGVPVVMSTPFRSVVI